jgi:hypothetical protein
MRILMRSFVPAKEASPRFFPNQLETLNLLTREKGVKRGFGPACRFALGATWPQQCSHDLRSDCLPTQPTAEIWQTSPKKQKCQQHQRQPLSQADVAVTRDKPTGHANGDRQCDVAQQLSFFRPCFVSCLRDPE